MSEPTHNDTMTITFWGTRGSRPVASEQFLRYGGSTTCVEVAVGHTVLAFDAGSGFNAFADNFQKRVETGEVDSTLHIFISHPHIDHFFGLEQPALMFSNSVKKVLHAGLFKQIAHEVTLSKGSDSLHADAFNRPYSPGLGELHRQFGQLAFQDHQLNHSVEIGPAEDSVRVTPFTIPHGPKDLSVGFRVEAGSAKVCILTDLSHSYDANSIPQLDSTIIEQIRDSDILIADSMYEEDELVRFPYLKNFGHTSREVVVAYAEQTGIKHVMHTHHNPAHNDKTLAAREKLNAEQAAKKGIDAQFAKEGLSLSLSLATRPSAIYSSDDTHKTFDRR